jgi:predicted ArsR family transcriptional regulator
LTEKIIIFDLTYRSYNLIYRSVKMLNYLINPKSKEQILIYIAGRKEGYAREIANYFDSSLSPIQNQLENLEQAGIVISKSVGRTIVFELNPRYAFNKELVSLLEKAISFLPEGEREKLLMIRKRPRRKGKPI